MPSSRQRVYMKSSTSTETADVHSSRIAKRGRAAKMRAIATRCFSPPDSTSAQSHTASQPPSRSSRLSSRTSCRKRARSSSVRPSSAMSFLR
mmetsp:Transcript_13621/g.47484  ORF Transcript_13621/g.47484 Transcript_13621/m.47484 type:complete len:92 (-) Transcript_13621:219-494(-)